jgi:uncharacterized protein
MPGPAGEIDRALQFHRVVRFFEQALLDLGDVGCNLAFLEPEDLEGDGLADVVRLVDVYAVVVFFAGASQLVLPRPLMQQR